MQERTTRLLHQGLRVALVGRPNVGKSSLLNALLGEEKAIVTNIPGTTRDLVSGEMNLGGIRVQLTDTAGLRETEDAVEQIGVARSRKAMAETDVALLVLEGSEPLGEEDRQLLSEMPVNGAIVVNKNDLPQRLELPETGRSGAAEGVSAVFYGDGRPDGCDPAPAPGRPEAGYRPSGGGPGDRQNTADGHGGHGSAGSPAGPGGDHRRSGGRKTSGQSIQYILCGEMSRPTARRAVAEGEGRRISHSKQAGGP